MRTSTPHSIAHLILAAALVISAASCHADEAYRPLDGDIVFHTSRSTQSPLIQLLTDSPYSHVAIVYLRDGEPRVFEAVEPVRSTPLAEWVARGEGHHFVAKRLADREAIIDRQALERMLAVGRSFDDRHYDSTFAWSDERLYCSELVWKIYQRALAVELAPLQRFGDFDLDQPAVRAAAQLRFAGPPPTDHPVVTPAALFASPQLVTVFER